jgi:hypothetical protein
MEACMSFELPKISGEWKMLIFWLAIYWLGYLMGWLNCYKVVWIVGSKISGVE